jgi:selenocysteine lyase/cysteine desulfurase
VRARKDLFGRALAAAPGRLHFAAHSHHLWPDATYDAQVRHWEDAARLADRKWDYVLGELWETAQRQVAEEIGLPSPSTVVFQPSTHLFLVAILSAFERRPVRVLATDGEFHSFRRQAARWLEAGAITLEIVPTRAAADFADRFLARAASGEFDLVLASQVFFQTGQVFERAWELAAIARPEGPWVVVDGYHGFRAIKTDLGPAAERLFYLSGGYKYAMAGEGAAFLHAPEGFASRPVITGWFAEFGELEGPAGGVGFARDATRFLGATFDSTGLYRFVGVGEMLAREGLTTAATAAYAAGLQADFLGRLAAGETGRLAEAELLNPLDGGPHARFLAFRHPHAQAWKQALMERDVITDVRDDVLRIGFAIYHDSEDLAGLCRALSAL